jgi:hypothetical protein
MTHEPQTPSGRDTIQAGRDVTQFGGDYVAGNKLVYIYQTVLRPVPIKFSAGVQRMVEDYTAIFGGRDAELARLDTFLTEDERPFGLLIAPTGRGKTTLLIHWLARVQQQHPDWRVVFAPISIRYQTASEHVALLAVAKYVNVVIDIQTPVLYIMAVWLKPFPPPHQESAFLSETRT